MVELAVKVEITSLEVIIFLAIIYLSMSAFLMIPRRKKLIANKSSIENSYLISKAPKKTFSAPFKTQVVGTKFDISLRNFGIISRGQKHPPSMHIGVITRDVMVPASLLSFEIELIKNPKVTATREKADSKRKTLFILGPKSAPSTFVIKANKIIVCKIERT